MSWVKTQDGLPYQWAGNGNPSWNCSGLMSAIESVIRGERPHRRWATGSFSGNTAPSGWVRNLNSPFMIGITNAGVGHTAGTLGGMNVELSGGRGVRWQRAEEEPAPACSPTGTASPPPRNSTPAGCSSPARRSQSTSREA